MKDKYITSHKSTNRSHNVGHATSGGIPLTSKNSSLQHQQQLRHPQYQQLMHSQKVLVERQSTWQE